MSVVKSRAEQLLIEISRVAPNDPSLKTLATLGHVASRISDAVQSRHISASSLPGSSY